MKKLRIPYQKRTWIFKLLFFLEIVIALGMTFVAACTEHLDTRFPVHDVRQVSEWHTKIGGEDIACNSDVDLAAYLPEGERSFVLESTLPDDITDKDELAFRISDKRVRVSIGGKEVASFGYNEDHPLWETSGRYFKAKCIRKHI